MRGDSAAGHVRRARPAERPIVEAPAAIVQDSSDGEIRPPSARQLASATRHCWNCSGGRPAGIRNGSGGFPTPTARPFRRRCGRRTAPYFVRLVAAALMERKARTGRSARSRPPRARPGRTRNRTRRRRRTPDLAPDRAVLAEIYRSRRMSAPTTHRATPTTTAAAAHAPAANRVISPAAVSISFNMEAF